MKFYTDSWFATPIFSLNPTMLDWQAKTDLDCNIAMNFELSNYETLFVNKFVFDNQSPTSPWAISFHSPPCHDKEYKKTFLSSVDATKNTKKKTHQYSVNYSEVHQKRKKVSRKLEILLNNWMISAKRLTLIFKAKTLALILVWQENRTNY